MSVETIVLLYGSVITCGGLFYWMFHLRTETAGELVVPTFGSESEFEFDHALLRQYIHQQKVAFALVCIALVLGLMLAAVLIIRVISSPTLDLKLAAAAIPLAGDIWLGRGCWRLYERSGTFVTQALARTHSPPPVTI